MKSRLHGGWTCALRMDLCLADGPVPCGWTGALRVDLSTKYTQQLDTVQVEICCGLPEHHVC